MGGVGAGLGRTLPRYNGPTGSNAGGFFYPARVRRPDCIPSPKLHRKMAVLLEVRRTPGPPFDVDLDALSGT